MKNYNQKLREGVLESCKLTKKTPEESAFCMNMIEAVIEGEMSVNQIMDAIENDTLPVRYKATSQQIGE